MVEEYQLWKPDNLCKFRDTNGSLRDPPAKVTRGKIDMKFGKSSELQDQ